MQNIIQVHLLTQMVVLHFVWEHVQMEVELKLEE